MFRACGRLRVARGRSRGLRLLASVLRLPRASEAAETRLEVTSDPCGQQWRRTFDGRRIETRQYHAGDGLLAERFGVLELRFRLEASETGLLFRQLAAALVYGSIRLRVPAAWAPTVEAREDPAGPRQLRIHVGVSIPALGPVLTYDGTIEIEDARG